MLEVIHTSVNDFIASNFGYDRRNTFTPQANDQFLIRRSDNNDWRRFVVSTWSPTQIMFQMDGHLTQSTEWNKQRIILIMLMVKCMIQW